MKIQFALKRPTTMRYQIIAGVGAPIVRRLTIGSLRSCLFRTMHGAFGDLDFSVFGSAGEIFDRVAVVIARGEIHVRKITSIAQNLIHEADAFEEHLPVELRHQAHAGDDVAHGDSHGSLLLVLRSDNLIRGGALSSQTLVQQYENGANFRVQVAQTLHELNGKSPFERFFLEFPEHAGWGNHSLPAGAEETIGEQIGLFATAPAEQETLRDPAQILDQHDS